MAGSAIDHYENMHFEPKNLQNISGEENNIMAAESNHEHPHGEHMPEEESTNNSKTSGTELLDKGYLQYG